MDECKPADLPCLCILAFLLSDHSMMDYARKVRNSRPCKVVMLGDAGSGKTCLLERFLHDSFDVKSKPTIGAAFGSKMLDTERGLVSLQIWDTAGQERYLSLASLYYRNAQAAIICCDLTERASFKRMEYWIKAVRSAEKDCKIYVCGTKADLIWDKLRSRAIQSEELTIFKASSIETSSKANYNVFPLFQQIGEDFEQTYSGEINSTGSSRSLYHSNNSKQLANNNDTGPTCCSSS